MSVLVDNDTQLVRLRHHRPRGHVPRAQQPALRHERRRRRHARQGRPGRRGHPGLQHVPRGGRRDRRQHGDDLRAAARSPPTRSSRPRTPASRRSSRSPRASPPTTSCASTTTSSATHGRRLIGPNCPGILSPGKANVGIIPASFFKRGQRRRRLALGHADLPDRQRAGPARLRQLVDRRHRRRPGPGLVVHRHHRAVRGRPARPS